MRNREQYRGTKNICGIRIERLRKELGLKQKDLCESMALQGVPNTLDISVDDLLGRNE